ncbi:ecotin family protein [Photobacterium satsumensis]|uniref:ecotin family protein n=1 Tax=Photobacterium satsumensis TaxID=2910239 RepID=UPI003D13DDD7
MKKSLLGAVLLMAAPHVLAADNADMFPEMPGFTKHVIQLDAVENENQTRRVQIIANSVMNVDCNIKALPMDIERRSLEGWGYSYYVLEKQTNYASTMMACEKEASDQNLQFHSDLLRYNSKLPLVIYAQDDVEVEHTVWAPMN